MAIIDEQSEYLAKWISKDALDFIGKRILVAEDNPSVKRLVCYTLERAGYQVLSASNGVEGLRMAREEKPDLLVLDVMLPGLDGFELCHRLRTDPQTAQLPILIFSAKTQDADLSTGLSLGADDYLIKPADPSEIVKRVANLLAKGSTAHNETRDQGLPVSEARG